MFARQTVTEATEQAILAAEHLTDQDAGMIAALRVCAGKVDDPIICTDGAIGLYLKYCESLGLAPTSKVRMAAKPTARGEGELSELAKLRLAKAKRSG